MEQADKQKYSAIIRADQEFLDVLKRYVESHKISLNLSYVSDEIEGCDVQTEMEELKHFICPVRLGCLIDYLSEGAARSTLVQTGSILSFGDAKLDPEQSLFSAHHIKQGGVRLTEKEVAILCYLHEADGRIVTRKDLLSAVWEYADTVETHTLETHIYRLRQKIEKDTSRPEIILTEEAGYRIGK